MKHGDLHPREKVGDITYGREDGNRVELHDFLHGFQLQLILTEQYRTLRIDEPGCLVAPSANLILQWTKDRIGIRQCCKKDTSSYFDFNSFRFSNQCAKRRRKLLPQRCTVAHPTAKGRSQRRRSSHSRNRSQRE